MLVLAAAAAALRLSGLATVPPITDNADEVQFAWAGLSQITQGEPHSWSYFPAYLTHTFLHANGTVYPIVHPWFDHPPLFGLFVGGFAWLAGERTFTAVTAEVVRLPVVALSVLTIPLGQTLGRRLVGRPAALLGVALLALAPAPVLFGRIAETEALVAPLLLGALIATHRILSGEAGRWTWAVLVACCLLAPLTKVPGLAVAGVCATVLVSEGRWRAAELCVGAGVAGLAAFALYGALLNWNMFVAIWQSQEHNRSGVMGAFEFIAAPAGINRPLRDGWWLLGWIGLGLLLQNRRAPRSLLLLWPVVAYAAAVLILADQSLVSKYGWYRTAVLPEVYLAAGFLLWRMIAHPSLGVATVVLITGGAAATTYWLGRPWLPPAPLLVLAMAAVILPAAMAHRTSWRPVARVAAGAALLLLMAGNVYESVNLGHTLGGF